MSVTIVMDLAFSMLAACALLFINLIDSVENAPTDLRMRVLPSFPKVQVDHIKTNASCPFVIESDVNESRIPAKIDRIKCAPTKSDDCRNCKNSAGYECVQAVMGVTVTFFNRKYKEDVDVVPEKEPERLQIQNVIDGSMYTAYEQRLQVEVGCFCANISNEPQPADIMKPRQIDS